MREREKVFDPGRPMIRENKYRVEFLRASASTTILMKNCGSAGGFSLIQNPSQFYSRRANVDSMGLRECKHRRCRGAHKMARYVRQESPRKSRNSFREHVRANWSDRERPISLLSIFRFRA